MSRGKGARLLVGVGLLLLVACGGGAADGAGVDAAAARPAGPTLYWLDIMNDDVYRATGPDFSDGTVVVDQTDTAPDGVAVDPAAGTLYWSAMGDLFGFGGGSLQRSGLDGSGVQRIVEPGITTTPKQLALDLVHGRVYWADREGASLWRSGLDGSDAQPVVSGHGLVEVIGVAVDAEGDRVYFTDRMTKTIYRAGLEVPAGQAAGDRTDVEELVVLPAAASPIDLALDLRHRRLYWTDRQLGTVSRAGLDVPPGETAAGRTDVETVVEGLTEPIGIAIDAARGTLYYGQLGDGLAGRPGTITEASLDGTSPREVARSTTVTGLAVADVPAG
jgi:DNA-binding beta-propeller fold protein YncE